MTGKVARGVGVDGSIGPQAVAELGALAEALGYASFWFNVATGGADPVETLRRTVAATDTIPIGIGVVPLDGYPVAGLAPRLRDIGVNRPRVIVGIAAGQVRKGGLELTEDAIGVLRHAVPACRIATAGYGPNILQLGGRLADVVLGNWMTPGRLGWMAAQVREGARQAGRPAPPISLYHRAARGAQAVARIRREMAAYARYPVHAKHQAAMGNPDLVGIAANEPAEVDAQISPYAALATVVLRPLPQDLADIAEWRSLLEFFAPHG